MADVPPFPAAMTRIGGSDLSPVERDVLRTMLRWWNPRSGELWPSFEAIAADAGRNVSTVRRVVRALEGRGVVEIVDRSAGGIGPAGRGRTHRIRLHLDRLNPRQVRGLEADECPSNPRVQRGLEGAEPARTARQTRAYGASNPRPRRGEPSTHKLPDELTIGQPDGDSAAGAWVDGQAGGQPDEDLRSVLAGVGIRGPNLDLLARAKLTASAVRREARDVAADPKVRSKPAVIARRLADLGGVDLERKPTIDLKTKEFQARLEELRRQRKAAAVGEMGASA